MEETTIYQTKQRKNDIWYILAVILLLLTNAFFAWKYFTMKKEKVLVEVKVKETTNEKQQVEDQLKDLLAEYETLKTNNSRINTELEEEKAKIRDMLEELKTVKANNWYQIQQYKKELNTLREIMRSYIVQIDSLNTRNQILRNENQQIKTDFKTAVDKNQELTDKNKELKTQVDIASTIKAFNIVATGINDKGKEVPKAKKLTKLRVCFTLSENSIAPSGAKWVYIRIAGPDQVVLTDSPDNLFAYNNDKIVYTEKREVNYQNQNVDMCIYWNKTLELLPGAYTVDIFTDGKLIGTGNMALK
jgi:myosin heavy subunit